MVAHLRLAVWSSPDGVILDAVETAVQAELLPPLNVAKVSTPWRPLVQAGRRRLAAQAKAWATGQNAEVRRLAEADDRSVSSWIRRAVEHELEQQTGLSIALHRSQVRSSPELMSGHVSGR